MVGGVAVNPCSRGPADSASEVVGPRAVAALNALAAGGHITSKRINPLPLCEFDLYEVRVVGAYHTCAGHFQRPSSARLDDD